ncbi:YMD3-like protein [Mya arenaria]|uniref:YMD3-like protein n=1 Tax=Mya arenaria TaxID=6604 RepID=A0ABY7DR72_MYAAR|nr:YMD3-like protein [Mya arenaria]
MQSFSRENKNVKFLLTVIDVFSKYGWMIPLKDKTGKSVADALKQILMERRPKKMWVEKGKEFYNKDVQNLVVIYSTENEEKSSVVQRRNRTMKEKMWKYCSANSTNKYIDILNDLVDQYNDTKHSSIKMTHVEASKKNENRVITKKKKTFEKGHTPRWTEEVFTVSEIQYTNPELQKTDQEIFRIERVIQRKGKKALVKWIGYPESFNSWKGWDKYGNRSY